MSAGFDSRQARPAVVARGGQGTPAGAQGVPKLPPWDAFEPLATTVLYEGHVLYPYRPSALKNQWRWTLGTLAPPGTTESPSSFRLEVLIEADSEPRGEMRFCFLDGEEERMAAVPALRGEHAFQWESRSRRRPRRLGRGEIEVPGSDGRECPPDPDPSPASRVSPPGPPRPPRRGRPPRRCDSRGRGARRGPRGPRNASVSGSEQREWAGAEPPSMGGASLKCQVRAEMTELEPGLWKWAVEAANTSDEKEGQGGLSLGSAQLRCALAEGAFVSAQDPGPERAAAAADCHCVGAYPVLVGEPGRRDRLLGAPIILEDYARVAPQSPGDFCDASEMDELLMLRVLTLSEAEKAEIRAIGGKGLAILEQCTAGGLGTLHGGVAFDPYAAPPESVRGAGRDLRIGDRVRLHPRRGGGDLFDQVLEGKDALIQAIEQDLEGGVQLAVVVEDDPGRDLGELRQSGHRFFFAVAEVEPL